MTKKFNIVHNPSKLSFDLFSLCERSTFKSTKKDFTFAIKQLKKIELLFADLTDNYGQFFNHMEITSILQSDLEFIRNRLYNINKEKTCLKKVKK